MYEPKKYTDEPIISSDTGNPNVLEEHILPH